MAIDKSGSDIATEKYKHEERKHLRELKWKELMSRVDAYRFYIKLILEVNAFFYATTGAVVLVYLNKQIKYLEFFLLLPILMGTVVGSFLIYAIALQHHNSQIINNIRNDLNRNYEMKIEDIPDLRLLNRLLLVFGLLFFIVAGSISLVPWLGYGISLLFAPGLSIVIGGLTFSLIMRRRYSTKQKATSQLKARTAA